MTEEKLTPVKIASEEDWPGVSEAMGRQADALVKRMSPKIDALRQKLEGQKATQQK